MHVKHGTLGLEWGLNQANRSFRLKNELSSREIEIQQIEHVGVSENSLSLNPMVLLIIIPMKNGYFIGNINPTFSDKPMWIEDYLRTRLHGD